MAGAKETQIALFDAIGKLLEEADDFHGTMKATMVRDAAVAFRAVMGGPQPGSIVIEK